MTRDLLLDLFHHMEWADGQVWTATLKHDAASSDSMLRHYLLHTASVQKAFLDAWTNQPLAFKAHKELRRHKPSRGACRRARLLRAGAGVSRLDRSGHAARATGGALGALGQATDQADAWTDDARRDGVADDQPHDAPPRAGERAPPTARRRAAAGRLHCVAVARSPAAGLAGGLTQWSKSSEAACRMPRSTARRRGDSTPTRFRASSDPAAAAGRRDPLVEQARHDHDHRFTAGVDKVPRRIVDGDVDMTEIGS